MSLYATRWMAGILETVGGPVAVVDLVVAEALNIRRGGTGDDARELEPIDLAPLIAAGYLREITTDDEEELQTFIDLVTQWRLDDGEALTAAIAIRRGYVVVTDDRKVERCLADRLQLRSTLDLIRVWAEQRQVNPDTLRRALVDVRDRRSYIPAMSHPLKSWWDLVIGEE